MSKFIKTDEVYILKQLNPKSMLAFVAVDSPIYPLSRSCHLALESLKSNGFDIFFIFSQCNFPAVKSVNRSKFTALEEGIGFIDLEETGTALGFLKCLEYMVETAKKNYFGYTITSLTELEYKYNENPELVKDIWSKFASLATSSLNSPVIEIHRHTPEALGENYLVEIEENEEYKFPILTDIFTGAIIKRETRVPAAMEMLGEGSYKTHYSPTFLPFINISFYKDFNEKLTEDWKETWRWNSEPKELLASGIIYFHIRPWIDRSPENINITSEENDKETEGL